MSEEAAPQQVAVVWSPEARADLRSIDRDTALRLLKSLDRFLKGAPVTSSNSKVLIRPYSVSVSARGA
jgi:hypothetical protein